MILFPENTYLKIEQVSREKTLTILIRSTEATSACTSCGTVATQIHRRYRRHLSDLPVSGYPVTLLVEVRRFFCHHPSCSHKTFAETFLPFAARYAQRTERFQEALQQLGLDVGANVGAKTGSRLGLTCSPSSLLRLMRKAKLTSPSPPATCIGIDDWAYKRKRRYGTLICDLETGKPLDLLPDRTVQMVRVIGCKSIPRSRSSVVIGGANTPPQHKKEPLKQGRWRIGGICCTISPRVLLACSLRSALN